MTRMLAALAPAAPAVSAPTASVTLASVPVVASQPGVHPLDVLYFAAAGLVALVVHEFAHAFAATRLGDVTPRGAGRLTLDPRAHADTFGTVILPGILLLIILFTGSGLMFAYAKPMPLNPWNTRRASRDTVLIAAAGPVANLLLAAVLGVLYMTTCGVPVLSGLVVAGITTNALFAAIHIIPIPPLDASRAITPFLPPRPREVFQNLEQYAALFMVAVFFILGGLFLGIVTGVQRGIVSLVAPVAC